MPREIHQRNKQTSFSAPELENLPTEDLRQGMVKPNGNCDCFQLSNNRFVLNECAFQNNGTFKRNANKTFDGHHCHTGFIFRHSFVRNGVDNCGGKLAQKKVQTLQIHQFSLFQKNRTEIVKKKKGEICDSPAESRIITPRAGHRRSKTGAPHTKCSQRGPSPASAATPATPGPFGGRLRKPTHGLARVRPRLPPLLQVSLSTILNLWSHSRCDGVLIRSLNI
ncbi:hypothetical protein CEXT_732031 [Caerostris extrusa]|uniref:Uncharacterized protein n=1 Tax=Caerostris extrusa TaxID=172846 RepID=A0AAV4T5V9_CAEEX|nr:hypothetical protein CEXT_732031 [Caerostris extrusa]